MHIDPQILEWAAGGLFVCFYAYKRYNTSSHNIISENRNSTTFFRFSVFLILYLLSLLVIYWLFGSFLQTSPELLAKLSPFFADAVKQVLTESTGGEGSPITGPILAALMLTTLLPILPKLQSFDRWLLGIFWGLGHIPGQAFWQSEKLRRAPLTFSPRRRKEIANRAKSFEIPEDRLVFEESSTIEHQWVRLCHLMLELESWKAESARGYMDFLSERENRFDEIEIEFMKSSRRLASYERRHAEAEVTDASVSQEILDDLRDPLRESLSDLIKQVCTFISCGVLAAERTAKGRRSRFSKMGFEEDEVVVKILTSSQIVGLISWIAAAFIAISIVEELVKVDEKMRLGPILFLSLIMTSSYGASVIAAMMIKSVPVFADFEERGQRSIQVYLLSTLLAVLFGLIAIISIRYTANAINGIAPSGNIDRVIADLGWSYPYLLQCAAIGFATAFLIDGFSSHSSSAPTWISWADAFLLGLAMLATSAVTYFWMEGIWLFEATRSQQYIGRTDPFFFVAKGTLVGLVIGYLVPTWHRKNRIRTPLQHLNRILSRHGDEVVRQAGELNDGEFKEALVNAAAYVASIDGRVDAIEQQVLRKFLFRLVAEEAVVFSVDEATTRFADLAGEFLRDEARVDTVLESLRPLVGRALLSEIIVDLCLTIGHADGIFETQESDAVKSITAQLNIDLGTYYLSIPRHEMG